MACYIASNDNRFYAALESEYGTVPAIGSSNRFAGIRLQAAQEHLHPRRRDKTGSRTYRGHAGSARTRTAYSLSTYLAGEGMPEAAPRVGPLFHAAMGGAVRTFAGGVVDSVPAANQLRFEEAHGLQVGQGVAFGGELRFVTAIVDALTVELNVPFSLTPTQGSVVGATVSYSLGGLPKSVSLFDYWSPDSAVQRILCGALVDELKMKINGDYHEFEFKGPAADLVDSTSFASGQGQLTLFPDEPAIANLMSVPIPGHLGQAWIGASPERFYTITEAELRLTNNIDLRSREFGQSIAKCFASGEREVRLGFSLYEQDSAATKGLYQAAKTLSPIQVMFQLGQQAGQLFGVYLKSVVPETPAFDDRETKLQWKFADCVASGIDNDELYVSFG